MAGRAVVYLIRDHPRGLVDVAVAGSYPDSGGQASTGVPEMSDSLLAALLDAAPDAILTVDGAGRVVLVNAQTERMFGYAREELRGSPIELLLPERFRARHADHRAAYAARPRTRPMGHRLGALRSTPRWDGVPG
jgi:PAS domain-containing protein